MTKYTELIERFTALDDAACETEAIALGRTGAENLDVLAKLRQVDVADVRFWAVRALWANGSTEAIALLIETLTDKEEMVCSGAALALGELKAEAAVEALAHLLVTDPTAIGNHAADALAKIGQPSAPALIEALQHMEVWVRRRAAKALIAVESRQAIGPLFYALEDESYLVSHYAKEALAKMGVGQMAYFRV
jgi:HEAT repeat protein